jgi:hypothetical protein
MHRHPPCKGYDEDDELKTLYKIWANSIRLSIPAPYVAEGCTSGLRPASILEAKASFALRSARAVEVLCLPKAFSDTEDR